MAHKMNGPKNLKVLVLIDLEKYKMLEEKAKQLQTLGEKRLQFMQEPKKCATFSDQPEGKRKKTATTQVPSVIKELKFPESRKRSGNEDNFADSTINANERKNFIESKVKERETELPSNWWKVLND